MAGLEERLTQLLRGHIETLRYCPCGEWQDAGPGPARVQHNYAEHLARVVLEELALTPVYAPVVVDDDGYSWPFFNEWYDDRRQAEKAAWDAGEGATVGQAHVMSWVGVTDQ